MIVKGGVVANAPSINVDVSLLTNTSAYRTNIYPAILWNRLDVCFVYSLYFQIVYSAEKKKGGGGRSKRPKKKEQQKVKDNKKKSRRKKGKEKKRLFYLSRMRI